MLGGLDPATRSHLAKPRTADDCALARVQFPPLLWLTRRRQELASNSFCLSEAFVQSSQWQPERFGNGDIPRIITRYVMTQLPDAICEGIEGEQLDAELHEILMRAIRLGFRDLLRPLQAAKDVRHFNAHQLRRMKRSVSDDFLGPSAVRASINERRNEHR